MKIKPLKAHQFALPVEQKQSVLFHYNYIFIVKPLCSYLERKEVLSMRTCCLSLMSVWTPLVQSKRKIAWLYSSSTKWDVLQSSFFSSITELLVTTSLNTSPLTSGVLPDSLRTLRVQNCRQQFMPGSLPTNLETLDLYDLVGPWWSVFLGHSFGIFPPSLKNLSLPCSSNKLQLGVLPKNLQQLRFGRRTIIQDDGSINVFQSGILPDSLTVLRFGNEYISKLKPGIIPNSVKILELGNFYNYPLEKESLPTSLESLRLGASQNHPLTPGVLSEFPFLQSLDLNLEFNQELTPGILPISLKKLRLSDNYNFVLYKGCFPANLTSLHLGDYQKTQVLKQDIIPPSVLTLQIKIDYDDIEPCMFPSSLTSLELTILDRSQAYNFSKIPGLLPKALLYLSLRLFGLTNYQIQHDILENFPTNLIHLNLGSVRKTFVGLLPVNLQKLKIYDYRIDVFPNYKGFPQQVLPTTLLELIIPEKSVMLKNKMIFMSKLTMRCPMCKLTLTL